MLCLLATDHTSLSSKYRADIIKNIAELSHMLSVITCHGPAAARPLDVKT